MKKLSEPVDFTKFCQESEMKTLVRAMGFDPEPEKPDGVYVKPGMIVYYHNDRSLPRSVAPDRTDRSQQPWDISFYYPHGGLDRAKATIYYYQDQNVLGYEKE